MGILTSEQKKFLELFFSYFPKQNFFLTGGTALAQYYLRHRLSEDLDIFTTDQDVDFGAVSLQMNKLINQLNFTILHQVSAPTFLQFILKGPGGYTLKIDIVKDVPVHFGKIRKVGLFYIDSLENIAVGKLLAIFGRTAPKDFIDVYFLFKEKKVDFKKIFELAKKKDLGLNEFYLAEMFYQITKVKDFPETLKPFNKKGLVRFFMELSDKLYKKIKPKE